MLRINNIELEASGYISTEGVMNISFETSKGLENIKELFKDTDNIEVCENYLIRKVKSIEPRDEKISVELEVIALGNELKEEPEETALDLETIEDYTTALENKAITISDVPIEMRDDIAIKLGV